jgi:hypothetical protein
MGVRYTISGDLLTLCLEGQFDTAELFRVGHEARTDPLLPRPFRLLFDLTESKASAAHREIIERVGELARYKGEFVPRIAVLVSDNLHYGLTRVHEGYASHEEISIKPFGCRSEALAWIDHGGTDPSGR